jgi:hypothetical protein
MDRANNTFFNHCHENLTPGGHARMWICCPTGSFLMRFCACPAAYFGCVAAPLATDSNGPDRLPTPLSVSNP